MRRIVDEPYFTYSAYNALTSGIQVKCPKCHGAGVVTADDDNAYFRCLRCGHQEIRDRTIYRYDVHNQCKNCGRYYRVDIEDEERQHFSVLHVACPYCGTTMSGEVHKTAEAFSYIAVSYTHLDVYKRQAVGWMERRISRPSSWICPSTRRSLTS